MTNSSYQQPPIDTANLVTGYYGNGKPVTGKYHVYPEQAAAGLWTTPTDLAKYIIECQLALEGRSKKVLSQAMMKKRLTPYIDSNAALGVFIEKKEGQSLKQLKSIATVRSVGASTRIEGSRMSDEEVEVLLKQIDITKLSDRDSQEVVGYFETLDIITESFENIDINNVKAIDSVFKKYLFDSVISIKLWLKNQ